MSICSTATKKEKITRYELRQKLDQFNLACELFKHIKHFFPNLIPLLKNITDPRNQSYITYELCLILFVRILCSVFHLPSMRSGTVELNNDNAINNIAKMLGYKELPEIPHWSTINDCLKKLEPSELEQVISQLANRLIRSKVFNNSRIRGKYWQVLVDGTGLYSFKEKHCDKCLTKEHKNKKGELIYIEYYHYVLEAKLVLLGNIVISIGTEFVDNDDEHTKTPKDSEKAKQDCELKAFYRLEKKIKAAFPHLPICLTGDSLYACEQVFEICQNNKWHLIVRFKDGRIKTLAEDFHRLKDLEPTQCFSELHDGILREYKFVCAIEYGDFKLNIVECVETKPKKDPVTFVFITDLPIRKKNCGEFVSDGRRRWRIENEGFDAQKNHGYYLEHTFSKDYTAIKNHYLLIQIGHAISQILERNLLYIERINLTIDKLHEMILEAFRTTIFTVEEIVHINSRCQIRLII